MRIVAGEFKGRVIKSPDEATTRPTIDRVRESMFSSINSRIDLEGACVLDAFGGSGALGIEALSRGASSCLFFEKDDKARKILNGNLQSLGLKAPQARCMGGNVIAAAERPLHSSSPFGLVLLDPPYALEACDVLAFLQQLASNGDLADGCLVVYEHAQANKQAVLEAANAQCIFALDGQKKYGKVGVTYLLYSKEA